MSQQPPAFTAIDAAPARAGEILPPGGRRRGSRRWAWLRCPNWARSRGSGRRSDRAAQPRSRREPRGTRKAVRPARAPGRPRCCRRRPAGRGSSARKASPTAAGSPGLRGETSSSTTIGQKSIEVWFTDADLRPRLAFEQAAATVRELFATTGKPVSSRDVAALIAKREALEAVRLRLKLAQRHGLIRCEGRGGWLPVCADGDKR